MSEATIVFSPSVTTPQELRDLVKRCYVKNPDKKDLAELRQALQKDPDLFRAVFDFAGVVQAEMIENLGPQPAMKAALASNLEALRRDLGYSQAPMLEKALIEDIAANWLRVEYLQFKFTRLLHSDHKFKEGLYWDRLLSSAQARYLKACEALAKVRRLTRPALQVNIAQDGGQQVNVAGDVKR